MKILLAINATKPKILADRAMRWAARTGYEMRIFAPRNKRKKFIEAVDDANYNYYLDIKHSQVITKQTDLEYAKANGFDLILYVPEDLWTWRKGMQFKPLEIIMCTKAVGRARIEFGRHPRKRTKKFANGCRLERVKYAP